MKTIKTSLIALLIIFAFVTKGYSQTDSSHLKAKRESSGQSSPLTNFLKKNPTISNVHWKSDNNIIIKLKNGTTQAYNLSDADKRQSFENKYGTPPAAPPPPPSLKKQQSR